tara:strand:- start:16360 stop:17727 length:1368 start_codon:yes stop_codon:yes gene_type:complete
LNFNPSIFRAYDIRGIAYEDLSEDLVVSIGKALGTLILRRGLDGINIGRDGRLSSPDMFRWITEGITSTGCNVVDLGIIPTPLLYFSTHMLKYQNGVVITGSHNSSEYNGFKIVVDNKSLFGEEIQTIKKIIESLDFSEGNGKKEEDKIIEAYIKELTSNIKLKRSVKVVIDCGNGATSVLAKECYEKLECEVIDLFSNLDGNFPNHHPDPSKPENMKDLIEKVISTDAEIGIAFDGDGDRLGVVSAKGEIIYPDMQMILFSQQVLKRKQGSKIVYDVKCSKLLPESITKNGGVPIISKTGHSFIKNKIRQVSAALGGEMSGHIFFNDRWPGFDDAIYSGARMLEIISIQEEGVDLFDSLPQLTSTPEINIETEDEKKFGYVEEFKSLMNFPEADVLDIDGVRVEFDYGWGLLRASNTSPVLVLRFEAINEDNLEKIKEKFRNVLGKIDPQLKKF